MIDVHGLEKRFGQVVALCGLSFRAEDGSITGLLGENGAGKTTTLRLICGALAPDAGRVALDGLEAAANPSASRQTVGALLDHQGLYGRLSARENIAYFGELRGISLVRLRVLVAEILQALGLDAVADRRVAALSEGQRMKVALGRILVHHPKHILLDEPTNGLDVSTVRALRALLLRKKAEGACVVLSSHILDEVGRVADRIVILAKGTVVAQGTADEICRATGSSGLEDAFVTLTTDTRVSE